MPMIEVTAPDGALSRDQQDRLMQRLTETLLKWEGAPKDSQVARAISWGYYHTMPRGDFYIAGVPSASPRLKVEITTPVGALGEKTRAGLVAEIETIMREETGETGGGGNHWVLLREIAEGHWASGGRIFRMADIRDAVMNERLP